MGRFLSRLISVNSHWEVGALQIDLSFAAFSFPIQIFSKDTIMWWWSWWCCCWCTRWRHWWWVHPPTSHTTQVTSIPPPCHATSCPLFPFLPIAQCNVTRRLLMIFWKVSSFFPALLQMSDLNPSTLSWHDSSPLTLLSLHCRILPRPGAKIALKFMPGTCSAAIWCPQPIHNTDKVKGRSKEKSLYFGAAIVSWHNNRYKCLINKLIN